MTSHAPAFVVEIEHPAINRLQPLANAGDALRDHEQQRAAEELDRRQGELRHHDHCRVAQDFGQKRHPHDDSHGCGENADKAEKADEEFHARFSYDCAASVTAFGDLGQLTAPARAHQAPRHQLEADQSDSAHIAAEPALPPPWTEARAAYDRRQVEMVKGLLAGYRAHFRPR